MRLSRHTTPTVREAMSPALGDWIAITEPGDAEARLGYSSGRRDWTCLIHWDGTLVGEAFNQPTPAAAFDVAVRVMQTRDRGAA